MMPSIAACVGAAGLLIPGTLAIDGQSYRPTDEEAERVWNDPNCERTRGTDSGIDWDALRAELMEVPFPETMPTVASVIQQLDNSLVLDHSTMICPFGVIAVMFFFIKYLIELPTPSINAAMTWLSILDGIASGMHPHLLDGSDWLVKDHRIIALRRAVLQKTAPTRPTQRPYVYVYSEGAVQVLQQLTQGAFFCGKGQWGMEVHIHEWLLSSKHLTKDAEEADYFFVPGYGICMFEGGFLSYPLLDEVYRQLVQELPYFNRSSGRDHIFTFGSGMSANVFKSWRQQISNSVFLTPETWLFNDFPDMTEPCFDTWKDVAIPGYLHRHEINSLVRSSKPLMEREHFAVFLGRTDPSRGPHPQTQEPDVRGMLHELYMDGKILVAHNLTFPMMHATMGNARFCFVPKGKSAWSLRFYEALFANCVPVVLSDHWELPFEDFLDVASFSIKWPMALVGDELLLALKAMPNAVVEKYMVAGRAARCWYVYPPLITELHMVPPDGDELLKACPDLADSNAYEGIMRNLDRKRQVSPPRGLSFDSPREAR